MSMQVTCAHLHLPLLRSSPAQSSDLEEAGGVEAVALATAVGGPLALVVGEVLGMIVGGVLALGVGALPTDKGNGFMEGGFSTAQSARTSRASRGARQVGPDSL
jgi:hypothetical protein